MALQCECGYYLFRLVPGERGAEAKCARCGKVIPNSVLREATKLPEETSGKDSL